MKCRYCLSELEHIFLNLGNAPPSNAYLTHEQLHSPEITFPLKLYVCDKCWLVQTEDYAKADELFSKEYAYFSSISQSFLKHASSYCEMITQRLALSKSSFVIEIASNDGYLLKNFVKAEIPCLGIEPTASTASAAEKIGVPVLREFFGVATANMLVSQGIQADLICGNNVYAHVPDINDFTQGLKILLRSCGTINLEFQHLLRLIQQNQFDTVYHEHFSYLSLSSVNKIFAEVGLRIYDVEELSTHGGSLRIFGCHESNPRPTTSAVTKILELERKMGLLDLSVYQGFQGKANRVKNELLMFLIEQRLSGKSVVAYGAAAKGNTLLNYAGIRPDLIEFVCDSAPSKQGKFMPGSHIPIYSPTELARRKPDWVLILPWNIVEEVVQQHDYIRSWGGKFVIAIPELRVLK